MRPARSGRRLEEHVQNLGGAQLRRRAWLVPSRSDGSPVAVVGVVLVLAVLLVPWRSGLPGLRGVPWAEDGRVFLQQAYFQGPWASLLHPYEGYVHVPARLIALLVDPFPIAWHGVLVCLAAIVVQGLLAGFAYCVVRAHVRTRVAAFLVPVVVTLVAVGPETVENLANLQWYLLYAACLAPLWTPAGRAGVIASTAVVLATTLASPFGAATVVFAALVWLLTRSRALVPVVVVGALGAVVQVVCMVTAPPRMQPTHPVMVVGTLLEGYNRRVLGDGVFGIGLYRFGASITSDVRGLVTIVLLLVLLVTVARRSGARSVAVPGLLLSLSVGTFAMPTVISGGIGNGVLLRNIEYSSRYYVAPALLLLTALAVLLDRLLTLAPSSAGTTRAPRWRGVTWQRALPVAVGVVVLAGVVVSFRLPEGYRDGSRAWSTEVARASVRCARHPQRPAATLDTAPALWTAVVPCGRLVAARGR